MVDISIVSGTYNRLESLQRMIKSVRASVGDFYNYEIVLVDGGSTDGTIEWCKQQKDIKLIEQGRLLGAVIAFNAGAYAAEGSYVILANDDIWFIDESIIHAYAYMETNPALGVGCFYQNRNRRDWHVEHMPAIRTNGESVTVPYGQVCIVPKWLGDKVGWWGNYLHTYGGDNELSCNIIEAGYYVAPIPCCCIADHEIQDRLRALNNGDFQRTGQIHPDTEKWRAKWTRNGRLGPIVGDTPKWGFPMTRRLRIMYLPLFEPGNQVQLATKHGLKDALSRYGTVLQYNYMRNGLDRMFDQAEAMRPDLYVFQIQNHDPNLFNTGTIQALKNEHPKAVFVNWNGDYHPENLFDPQYIRMMKEFHLAGHVTTQIKEVYDEAGVDWFYWQIGYEESYALPLADTPKYDVLFLGNGYNKARMELGEFLVGLREKGIKVGLYGSWPNGWANGNNLYNFDDGQCLMRNSTLIVSDQPYPDGTGFVSNRLFQALASGGGLVLQQSFNGMEELLGLKPGKHLQTWRDLDELWGWIDKYLDKPGKLKAIKKQGTEYALENFSFDRRAAEMFEELAKRGHVLWESTL